MASLDLSADEVKVLESVRQRLTQVVSSLQKFKDDVALGQPLPAATSIQASTTIIQQNLRTLTTYLAENGPLLERVAVHPATNFPGRHHENVLLQLLRKKPEPAVEELLERGRETAVASASSPSAGAEPASKAGVTAAVGDNDDDDGWGPQRELWAWARRYCDEKIGQYAMEQTNQVYTAEERAMGVEKVRTGLRRKLDEGAAESDDEDEDDEEQEGGGGHEKAKPEAERVPEEVRRVARLKLVRNSAVGMFELPPNADWEAKRRLGLSMRGPARGPVRGPGGM